MTNKKNTVAAVIFVLGILFIGIGVWTGEHVTVLQKAIRICLECIGIG